MSNHSEFDAAACRGTAALKTEQDARRKAYEEILQVLTRKKPLVKARDRRIYCARLSGCVMTGAPRAREFPRAGTQVPIREARRITAARWGAVQIRVKEKENVTAS